MKMTALNLHRYISIGRVVCILFTNFCLQSAIRRTTYYRNSPMISTGVCKRCSDEVIPWN